MIFSQVRSSGKCYVQWRLIIIVENTVSASCYHILCSSCFTDTISLKPPDPPAGRYYCPWFRNGLAVLWLWQFAKCPSFCRSPAILSACEISLFKRHKNSISQPSCPTYMSGRFCLQTLPLRPLAPILSLLFEANASPQIPCLSSPHPSGLAIFQSITLPGLAWPKDPLATGQLCLPPPSLSSATSQHSGHPPVGSHWPPLRPPSCWLLSRPWPTP